jgi:hypothetical protein
MTDYISYTELNTSGITYGNLDMTVFYTKIEKLLTVWLSSIFENGLNKINTDNIILIGGKAINLFINKDKLEESYDYDIHVINSENCNNSELLNISNSITCVLNKIIQDLDIYRHSLFHLLKSNDYVDDSQQYFYMNCPIFLPGCRKKREFDIYGIFLNLRIKNIFKKGDSDIFFNTFDFISNGYKYIDTMSMNNNINKFVLPICDISFEYKLHNTILENNISTKLITYENIKYGNFSYLLYHLILLILANIKTEKNKNKLNKLIDIQNHSSNFSHLISSYYTFDITTNQLNQFNTILKNLQLTDDNTCNLIEILKPTNYKNTDKINNIITDLKSNYTNIIGYIESLILLINEYILEYKNNYIKSHEIILNNYIKSHEIILNKCNHTDNNIIMNDNTSRNIFSTITCIHDNIINPKINIYKYILYNWTTDNIYSKCNQYLQMLNLNGVIDTMGEFYNKYYPLYPPLQDGHGDSNSITIIDYTIILSKVIPYVHCQYTQNNNFNNIKNILTLYRIQNYTIYNIKYGISKDPHNLKVGDIIHIPIYSSTTFCDKFDYTYFLQPSSFVFKIQVFKESNIWNIIDKYSAIPIEYEILLNKNIFFKIIEKKNMSISLICDKSIFRDILVITVNAYSLEDLIAINDKKHVDNIYNFINIHDNATQLMITNKLQYCTFENTFIYDDHIKYPLNKNKNTPIIPQHNIDILLNTLGKNIIEKKKQRGGNNHFKYKKYKLIKQ